MDLLDGMGSNACAGIDLDDCKKLDEAATTLLDARGLIMTISDAVGHAVSNVGGSAINYLQDKLGFDVKTKADEIVETVLWHMQSMAKAGMQAESAEAPWDWFHKIAVGASGAASGFFGAPGLIWDLPFTTGMIMRSIGDIARSFPGESLDNEDTKRACIEVFAFGGPEAEDDDIDLAYWSTRVGLSHVAIDALIKTVASRFGTVLAEKTLAQIVPIAGSVAGAGLNYAFMDYYQQMARIHFAIRGVERRMPDPSAVRACFSYRVAEMRKRRQLRPGMGAHTGATG
jgi:hypothetical protein